jgi:hypothetical protein
MSGILYYFLVIYILLIKEHNMGQSAIIPGVVIGMAIQAPMNNKPNLLFSGTNYTPTPTRGPQRLQNPSLPQNGVNSLACKKRQHMRFLRVLVLLLLSILITPVFAADKLLFAFDVIRHGDRTPILTLPDSSYNLLSALEAPLKKPPPYASRLNFSLFEKETDGSHHVHITLNYEPVFIPSCGGHSCSLEQFFILSQKVY